MMSSQSQFRKFRFFPFGSVRHSQTECEELKTATRSGYSGHLARHDKWTFPFSTGLFFGGKEGYIM